MDIEMEDLRSTTKTHNEAMVVYQGRVEELEKEVDILRHELAAMRQEMRSGREMSIANLTREESDDSYPVPRENEVPIPVPGPILLAPEEGLPAIGHGSQLFHQGLGLKVEGDRLGGECRSLVRYNLGVEQSDDEEEGWEF